MKIGVAKGAKFGEVFNGSIVIFFCVCVAFLSIFCGKTGQRTSVGNNGEAKENLKGKDIKKLTLA